MEPPSNWVEVSEEQQTRQSRLLLTQEQLSWNIIGFDRTGSSETPAPGEHASRGRA